MQQKVYEMYTDTILLTVNTHSNSEYTPIKDKIIQITFLPEHIYPDPYPNSIIDKAIIRILQ